jgi:hypothetical protein
MPRSNIQSNIGVEAVVNSHFVYATIAKAVAKQSTLYSPLGRIEITANQVSQRLGIEAS